MHFWYLEKFSSDSGGDINEGYPIFNEQTEPEYQYPVVYELNGGCSESSYFELVKQDSSVDKPEDQPRSMRNLKDGVAMRD